MKHPFPTTRKWVKKTLWLWSGLILLLSACTPQRSYEAALVLADIAAQEVPSHWKSVTPTPKRKAITYAVAGRTRQGNLYLPANTSSRASIVLVPGVVPQGKDDPRLVALAKTLARARFAVLTPTLEGFQQLQIKSQHPRIIADAVAYLTRRSELALPGPTGIGAFSFSVGLAVLASLEEDIHHKVRFILGVGGYYDLEAVIRFFTTGYFLENEHYMKPSEYGKLVFASTSLAYLREQTDQAVLRKMIQIKIRNPRAEIASLVPHLSPQGKAVYKFVSNKDPARFFSLLKALPQGLQRLIKSLNLSNKDLSPLQAQLILIHGKNDPLIPYTESIALANALPSTQTDLYLIEHILTHVDFKFQDFFTPNFWNQDLPDLWRLYRAVYSLLEKREPEKKGEL